MEKIVDGVELLRLIRDGEIERGRKIKVSYDTNYSDVYYFSGCNIRHLKGDYEIGSERLLNKKMKYEILEKEIDIQSIEELDEEVAYTNLDFVTKWSSSEKKLVKQQNNLIKAIKQLDKKLKEKE